MLALQYVLTSILPQQKQQQIGIEQVAVHRLYGVSWASKSSMGSWMSIFLAIAFTLFQSVF